MADPLSTAPPNGDVFVNCPFDDTYLDCFEALLFAITISGYRVRCALEESDAGDIRFAKLRRLIADSDDTIHDLSRTAVGEHGLPRFNMPFELGLALGARLFGDARQRRKRTCVMVAREHTLPRYLSDLAGSDPAIHHDAPHGIIRIVRHHLHVSPQGHRLPGAEHMITLFEQFRIDRPRLSQAASLTEAETHARLGYRNFMDLLHAFCATLRDVAAQYPAPPTGSLRSARSPCRAESTAPDDRSAGRRAAGRRSRRAPHRQTSPAR